MPRFDRYEKLRRDIAGSVKRGTVSARWADDSQSFYYDLEGKSFKFDIASGTAAETTEAPPPTTPTRGGRRTGQRGTRGAPERGRQFSSAISEDGKLKATTRDRNVFIINADGKNEVAVTTEGSVAARTKFGIASWVYGEELGVREAMWWSPDAKKLAFYKFDETPVKDYFLQYDQTHIQDTLDTEAYPKAGAPNPIVTLYVYDLETKHTTAVDTKFADPVLGEYVFDVRWSPDGSEILFNRTDRKQKTLQLCAADPSTGTCRTIVEESQPQSWAENHPPIQFLDDKHRFIWGSERNGYKNFYLYDLSGKLINTITQNKFDAQGIVTVDEKANVLYYLCRSGNGPYLQQLNRVNLDGTGDRRLTDPAFSHTVSLAPDGKHFVDVAQTVDTPPTSYLYDGEGTKIAELAKSDLTKFDELHLKKTQRITFTAADGKTTCYGTLQFPSDFSPHKKYPVIVSVYGGPESSGGAESFQVPNPITELGFLVASFDGRGTGGRGKAFRDELYGKLGIVEIDDQAAGAKSLNALPYVNGRIGIFGTSYGGYSSLMCLLRHPEVFSVSCSSSSVTDWLNYDSIYTERYNGLPGAGENQAGYDAGKAVKYVQNLKGKLMLYYGTADNNVHPSNTLQLIQALEAAGKHYDLQVGPDKTHTQMNATRMWEYFVTYLILEKHPDRLKLVWNRRVREKASSKT
jgi:dipeptidyl-peptidase-4